MLRVSNTFGFVEEFSDADLDFSEGLYVIDKLLETEVDG